MLGPFSVPVAFQVLVTCDREAATTRGCHLGYTDTLIFQIPEGNKIVMPEIRK